MKLFILPVLAVAAAAGFVAAGSERYARRQFEESDRQRSEALVSQFRHELTQRGEEVVRAVQGIADAEATLRMALELSQPQADPSLYSNDARGLASLYDVDFLEIANGDGTLISSAHWPARSGYRNDWVAQGTDWNQEGAFLGRVQLPDNVETALLAVRTLRVGDRVMYLIGGRRFDRGFLQTLAVPAGMRALLYTNLEPAFVPAALYDPDGPAPEAERFAPLIEAAMRGGTEPAPYTIKWSANDTTAETLRAVHLPGREGEALGILLVGSTQRDLAVLVSSIRLLGVAAIGGGILFGLLLSWWATAKVSRPLARLEADARDVQSGKPPAPVHTRPDSEVGRLGRAFDEMVAHLTREREHLLHNERAAARREMAHRIVQEVREPLFPIQMASEDLAYARGQTSERFDEVFFDSTATLRAEIERLKTVISRFSEFAGMRPPRPVPASFNEAVRAALKTLEPQFRAPGRPPVTPEIYLGKPEAAIEADPELLRLAVENMLQHSLDVMTGGGSLTVRTRQQGGVARLEISAAGANLPSEECSRLFMPAQSGRGQVAGLGLATSQAVASDHGGRIWVESAPGAGTTFRLEFPLAPAGVSLPLADNPPPVDAKPDEDAGSPGAEAAARPVAETS